VPQKYNILMGLNQEKWGGGGTSRKFGWLNSRDKSFGFEEFRRGN
jgi:hypothetical protein